MSVGLYHLGEVVGWAEKWEGVFLGKRAGGIGGVKSLFITVKGGKRNCENSAMGKHVQEEKNKVRLSYTIIQ